MLVVQCAGVAQLVEQLICNQPVAGSNPVTSFQVKRGTNSSFNLLIRFKNSKSLALSFGVQNGIFT
jgi:hypothetical protein